MNKLKIKLSVLLAIITMISCEKEKETFYQTNNKELLTEKQVNSKVEKMNKKMRDKNLDMVFKAIITDTLTDENKIIYQYIIKGESIGVTENVTSYEQMIGKKLPKFSFKNLNGKQISSNELIGKPIVINMWFTTCSPCVAEMPELNKIKADPKNSEIHFIAVTYETKEKVNHFLEKKEFNFEHISDAKEYCEKFTDQYPINIFVDREGVIKHIEGGMPLIYDRKAKKVTDKVNPSKFLKSLEEIKS